LLKCNYMRVLIRTADKNRLIKNLDSINSMAKGKLLNTLQERFAP
jgi:hypothetical protein